LAEREGESGRNENQKGGQKVTGKNRRNFTILLIGVLETCEMDSSK